MTGETGLAAAVRAASFHGDPSTMADTALAWVNARLADPATVEAVAAEFHAHRGTATEFCASCRWKPVDLNNDEAESLAHRATAVLAVVRGLLGGTGGEG